uniref:Uncharacterized protein n=1 Tax=Spongospora subterranea TaxID=70186 RepID=A0A0H5REC8_9EUKA|eukprot:CRZ12116.1 hypothetical protein [Spongospora subterranea]
MQDVKTLMQRVRISKPRRIPSLSKRPSETKDRPVIPWKLNGSYSNLDHSASSVSNNAQVKSLCRQDGNSSEGESGLNIAAVMEKVRQANEHQQIRTIPTKDRMPPSVFACNRGIFNQTFVQILREEQEESLIDSQAYIDFTVVLQSFTRAMGSSAPEQLISPAE